MGSRTRGRKKTLPGVDPLVTIPPEDKATAPNKTGPITALLSFLRGGKDEFMRQAELASHVDPAVAIVREQWLELSPRVQRRTTIDHICEMQGVDPVHYLYVVGEASHRFHNNAAILIAATNMPSVVSQCVKFAKKESGVQDRKMLFQATGFLPTPEGARINITQKNLNKAEVIEQPAGLPSFGASMKLLEDE